MNTNTNVSRTQDPSFWQRGKFVMELWGIAILPLVSARRPYSPKESQLQTRPHKALIRLTQSARELVVQHGIALCNSLQLAQPCLDRARLLWWRSNSFKFLVSGEFAGKLRKPTHFSLNEPPHTSHNPRFTSYTISQLTLHWRKCFTDWGGTQRIWQTLLSEQCRHLLTGPQPI